MSARAPVQEQAARASSLQLVQYSRGYCHLCDDMRDALRPLQARDGFELEVIDIDAEGNAALLASYDALVPVLCGRAADGSLVQLCHYFLDVERVRFFLGNGS